MKNNKTLKLASGLLILCLITTCIIGTTLAKYTTGSSASDTASVAKWGLQVSASGTLFGKAYGANGATTDANSIVATTSASVNTSTDSTIVAPGTKNDVGLQVKVKGQPEVAYEIKADALVTPAISDIILKAGEYGVMVEAHGINAATDFTAGKLYTLAAGTYTQATAYTAGTTYYMLTDYVNVMESYKPVTWSLVIVNGTTTTTTYKELSFAINAIKTAVVGSRNANDAVDITCTLTWEWNIANSQAYANGADTILANIQASAAVVKLSGTTATAIADSDYCLTVAGGIKVSATQVD